MRRSSIDVCLEILEKRIDLSHYTISHSFFERTSDLIVHKHSTTSIVVGTLAIKTKKRNVLSSAKHLDSVQCF